MKNILQILACTLVLAIISAEEESFCPKVLRINSVDNERKVLEGEISVDSDITLTGLWLKIILDKKAQLNSGLYGVAHSSDDNKQFLVAKRTVNVVPGETLKVPITIQYDREVPNIVEIRLNGRTICPPKEQVKIGECPASFSYEEKSIQNNEWYGLITLDSEFELHGIWLRIELDRVAELTSETFGEVHTDDNKSYLIKNREYNLIPGQTLRLPITVKYSPSEGKPSVTAIRLNGRPICDKTKLK